MTIFRNSCGDHGAPAHPITQRFSAPLTACTLFLASRLVVVAVLLVCVRRRETPRGESSFSLLAHYDGGHYLRIAGKGYFAVENGNKLFDEAFFPGFPTAIRLVAMVLGRTEHPSFVTLELAGLILSWVGGLCSTILLCSFFSRFGLKAQLLACSCLLFSPHSIFLSGVYTEGPFLALCLGSYLCSKNSKWGWSAFFAGLAASLRINGIFMLLVIGFEIWKTRSSFKNFLMRSLLCSLMVLSVPVVYWLYLYRRTHDVMYWMHVQSVGYGRGRTPIWVTIHNTFKMTHGSPWYVEYQAWMEFGAFLLFIFTIVYFARAREWGLSAFAAISIVSLSMGPVFLSIPRNVFDCFPVLLAEVAILNRLPKKVIFAILAVGAACMLITSSTFFASEWSG